MSGRGRRGPGGPRGPGRARGPMGPALRPLGRSRMRPVIPVSPAGRRYHVMHHRGLPVWAWVIIVILLLTAIIVPVTYHILHSNNKKDN